MKKLLFLMLSTVSICINAYDFTYKNATEKTIYFEPYAWGIGGPEAQFKFLKGERGATDSWGKRGPIKLNPGQQIRLNFKGLWCHGKIMVGTTKYNLVEISEIVKANLEQYNRIISDLTKAAIGSSVATAGASGAIIFVGIQLARLFEKSLCQNYHFIIGEKIDDQGNPQYFATATPW